MHRSCSAPCRGHDAAPELGRLRCCTGRLTADEATHCLAAKPLAGIAATAVSSSPPAVLSVSATVSQLHMCCTTTACRTAGPSLHTRRGSWPLSQAARRRLIFLVSASAVHKLGQATTVSLSLSRDRQQTPGRPCLHCSCRQRSLVRRRAITRQHGCAADRLLSKQHSQQP